MKIKTADLIGPALEWAVAKCEGRTIRRDPMGFRDGSHWIWEETPSGDGGVLIDRSIYERIGYKYRPSSNWSQGGPIIEREGISLRLWIDQGWCAYNEPEDSEGNGEDYVECSGPTPLIAAMRCYVASKLGYEVEIPDELMVA